MDINHTKGRQLTNDSNRLEASERVEGDIGGDSSPRRPRSVGTSSKHWACYGWFMSFGTFLPLVVFLGSYLVRLTLVGARIARAANGFGIWLSTFGQEPPGKDKLEARQGEGNKKSIVERIRPYSPPGCIERRGRPFALWQRSLWFIFVGWWLGAIWVLLSWSVLLMRTPSSIPSGPSSMNCPA